MKLAATLRENPLLRRLIQPKRIPLLFSVTIVAGIFYHYAPKLTWLWIILSLVLQGLLFKLFNHVLIAVGDDRDPGNVGIVGDSYCQRIDIEAAAGKQSRNLGQNARVVFYEN